MTSFDDTYVEQPDLRSSVLDDWCDELRERNESGEITPEAVADELVNLRLARNFHWLHEGFGSLR
jgi:hypothetical protein